MIDTDNALICLSDKMNSDVKFKKIECGYSHALLIDEDDRLYSFGANIYGQLGVGLD